MRHPNELWCDGRKALILGIGTLCVAAVALGTLTLSSSEANGATSARFVGDFEVAHPGWQQWSDIQYEFDRPLQESFELVSSPVRQGKRSGRFTARQGYSPFGHGEDSELVFYGEEQDNDDYWYAWSTLFPVDWREPYDWGVFAQWHSKLATSPQIGFYATENSASFTVFSGLADEKANRAQFDIHRPLLRTLSKGRWNDFVLHVHWSSTSTGFTEVFHRLQGERALRRLATVRHVPTFQFAPDGRGKGAYLLFGLYRGSHCAQPTQLGCTSSRGIQPPNVIYHDGFVRARTFSDAVSTAFPDPPVGGPPAEPKPVTLGQLTKPFRIDSISNPSGAAKDSNCSRCRVVTVGPRTSTTIGRARDDEDTAARVYRVENRTATVVRARIALDGPSRLGGNLAIADLRRVGAKGPLAELLVAPDRTLRVSSPEGALFPDGVDATTGIRLAPGVSRRVELRLTDSSLVVIVDGRARFTRRANENRTQFPPALEKLVVSVGIHHYDGVSAAPVRVALENTAIGTVG